jgi:aldehyde dehydrogenase (NAD+)
MKEEIFGPILPIITYNTIEDAIKFINERDKPLAIYYFGSNSDRNSNLIKVQEQTSSGSFVVNEVIVQMLSSHLPFGGVGASGYGRLHGK